MQNHAAKEVISVSYEKKTPNAELLKTNCWLLVKPRVIFKVLVMISCVISVTAPLYIYLREMYQFEQGMDYHTE